MTEPDTARNDMPKGARLLYILFKNCFVISCCTFGGGLVVISMLQKRFVDELKWIKQDEVMDMCAIAQACPGVMAVNTAIILGYRLAGVWGAIMTAIGTVLPPMIILSVVSFFYEQARSNRVVDLLFRGMQAGVVAVMLNLTINMLRRVLKGKSPINLALLLLSIAAVLFFNVDLPVIILACGAFGFFSSLYGQKKSASRKK